MILPIALLIAQAPSTTLAYPVMPVLEEARDTCATIAGGDRGEATAARGWQQDTRAPSGWLKTYVRQNSQLDAIVGEPVFHELRRKVVAGRELILYVFGVGAANDPSRKWGSCEVLDLNADGAISPDALVRWAGRKPEPSLPMGRNIVMRWVPGLVAGSADTAITYSPPGSALASVRPGLIYTVVARTGDQKQ
jgi:hypothetical protein